MNKHFAHRQRIDAITTPNEEWIKAAKKLARKSSIRSCLLNGMSCLTYLTMFVFTDGPFIGNYVVAASLILLLVSGFHHLHIAETIHNPLRRGLQKLSSGNNCQEALTLVETYKACREYQAQVLAQGREFIEFDYQLLIKIAKGQPSYLQASAEKLDVALACRKLHGLQEAPAT